MNFTRVCTFHISRDTSHFYDKSFDCIVICYLLYAPSSGDPMTLCSSFDRTNCQRDLKKKNTHNMNRTMSNMNGIADFDGVNRLQNIVGAHKKFGRIELTFFVLEKSFGICFHAIGHFFLSRQFMTSTR